MKRYNEYKNLNWAQVGADVLRYWKENRVFEKSVETREGQPAFTFYEGPPSANGTPGIHHVMARTVKDLFCRYKTQQGFQVKRKGGWDTHGLPVELQVEKELGITKDDIGKSISVEDYNAKCREAVMKFKNQWDDLTEQMGYWVDLQDPYITFEPEYIESIWALLKRLYEKGYLYKGYTIQPYSPAAGTGLSSHELNQPGTYKDVKDTTVVAQFKVKRNDKSAFLFEALESTGSAQGSVGTPSPLGDRGRGIGADVYFLAWTTTPWTLPGNSALAVGRTIKYVAVRTFNAYTHQPITVILAKELVARWFNEKGKDLPLEHYQPNDKIVPWQVAAEFTGEQLVGIEYEQLMPYVQPVKSAFRVILGDFVTTEDGTGIVHISPTFGADDFRAAALADIPPITVTDEHGKLSPLVDKQGRFVKEVTDFAGRYVKNYDGHDETAADYKTVDVEIAIKLKEENKAFRVEKYEHSYPHCWRTDKPILYYPLDSWFIKTTAVKDRLIELNKTINWKPESTGTGRFGNWLENLVDWNLSRSRYWGTPLPIWRTEDGTEEKCIGSFEELSTEIERSIQAGYMSYNPLVDTASPNAASGSAGTPSPLGDGGRGMGTTASPMRDGTHTGEQREMLGFAAEFAIDPVGREHTREADGVFRTSFDPHRPYVDQIILVSDSGQPMLRETDLIDVWFDSGAMPYAQWHRPFENEELFRQNFPADFIAEGVDQTRGWFFTLHALAVMLEDSVAFKNVIANGLVLDKNGNKMSKRLGNAIDPFQTISTYGPDATRWYMIVNAPPWDNLKFNLDGVQEVQRRFFGTLQNTYSFFALYANLDGFAFEQESVPLKQRTESDRWVISRLNTLIREVEAHYDDYDPTRAARAIQDFVTDDLSNWYVRLNRKRFWKGEYNQDKIAAYQTLYACLITVAKLAAPIAPFYTEQLYRDLNIVSGREEAESVHLAVFPKADETLIDEKLEERMRLAQQVSSLVHSLRKNYKIKVRQPLSRIMIPVLNASLREQLRAVEDLIKSEVNVKTIEYIDDTSGVLVKKVKPNFKELGRRFGAKLKGVAAAIQQMQQPDIQQLERDGHYPVFVDNEEVMLTPTDVEISSEDMPGWHVATEAGVTVALDTQISEELRQEGIARELVNRLQNLRKDQGLDVQDKIRVRYSTLNTEIARAIEAYQAYICEETQAVALQEAGQHELRDITTLDVEDHPVQVELEVAR